jgi:hypothetical protein
VGGNKPRGKRVQPGDLRACLLVLALEALLRQNARARRELVVRHAGPAAPRPRREVAQRGHVVVGHTWRLLSRDTRKKPA